MPMSPSRFDPSALPPARSFYEKELGRLRRPSRGWARANCPFHESKSRISFCVNLESGGFYCFGCETKGGDVVDFLRLRYKLDFKAAAQELGAWRGETTPAESNSLRSRHQERARLRADEAAQAESARRERIEARDHLHAVATLYDEAQAEHDWLSMSELLPRVRQAEEQYWQLAGLEVRHEC
jgi:hypothetical protein